ncbi:DNA repair protein Nse1 [Paecilomyces variotii No. 5]|uniref:Non-structural maintenance of chromosomes element 1 homolog n=1 Tax=Byssochlamys spectabilis (strain No. 5 / NBRC 109023) TaxID=1356009 RepID=V5FED6_BYSSN|nr:DNA repair protein Nse1 [Paecilomyces variotii No. 5]
MSNDVDEDGYNDSNRAFLQAFMARSTMTFEEAKPVLAAIFSAHGAQSTIFFDSSYVEKEIANLYLATERRPVLAEDITQADLSSYIAAANTAISPFDLEIRSTVHQLPGEDGNNGGNHRVYALVNTTSDPLTQLATTYTADEIAFVKRILDAMFETYNTRRSEAIVVTGMQAVQLAKVSNADRRESAAMQLSQGGAAQSLTMPQAESVMKRLLEEGWFEKSRKGFYSLSPRALMELRGWLVATYNEEDDDGRRANKIKFCAACKDIITVGQRCANRDCLGRLHDICMRNFFRMQQAEKCPVCKADWPHNKFVGERAITTTEQYQQGKRRSGNSQRQSNAVASASAVEDEQEQEQDDAEIAED